MRRGPWMAYLMFAIGLWVVLGALAEWAHRVKLFEAGREEVLRRARNLPRAAYGGMLGHLGVGVMVLGIVATTAWQSEVVVALKPGEKLSVAGYELTFQGAGPVRGPNYQETVGKLLVTSGGRTVTTLEPAKRLYDAPKQPTTEAGILNAWSGDLYTVLGDETTDGGFTVRVYFNPLVRLIWIGCLIMSLGGLLSLSDRRLRVGAPRASGKLQAAE
jgi:cytochrome c-type biogenesis protein CcmF